MVPDKPTTRSLNALLLLVSFCVTSVSSLLGSTHALALVERELDRPRFVSAQAADLMTVEETSITLAPPSRLEGIHQDVKTVVNRSGRALPVSVSMVGISGLVASVEPGILAPGGTGTIRLDGAVPDGVGTVTGTLTLYGFNQYVQIPIHVAVVLPDSGSNATPSAVSQGTCDGAPDADIAPDAVADTAPEADDETGTVDRPVEPPLAPVAAPAGNT